jgi:hypothetical protein
VELPTADPTEDQVLRKAKDLCRNDGKAWRPSDLNSASALISFAGVADDSTQAVYLHQAAAVLNSE